MLFALGTSIFPDSFRFLYCGPTFVLPWFLILKTVFFERETLHYVPVFVETKGYETHTC